MSGAVVLAVLLAALFVGCVAAAAVYRSPRKSHLFEAELVERVSQRGFHSQQTSPRSST